MGIVHTALYLEHEAVDDGGLGEEIGYGLVFLCRIRVVAAPLERVLAEPLPGAVIDGGDASVRAVWIPVRQHEAGCRNRGIDRIDSLYRLVVLLVGQHGVRADFQPFLGLGLEVHPEVVPVEVGIRSGSVLAVIASGHVIVQLVGGSARLNLVVLERSIFVEHFVKPVHVRLGEFLVILAVCQSDFLLVLDSLGRVHQVPLAAGYLGEARLGAQGNPGILGDASALRGDDDDSVGRTGTVDGGAGCVLKHGYGLYVIRADGIEIGCGNRNAVQDEERRGAGVDGIGSADLERCGGARLSGIGQHHQTGGLSLKGLVKAGCRSICDGIRLDSGYRTCYGSLLAHAVCDNDYILKSLCIALESDIVNDLLLPGRDEEGRRLESDELE